MLVSLAMTSLPFFSAESIDMTCFFLRGWGGGPFQGDGTVVDDGVVKLRFRCLAAIFGGGEVQLRWEMGECHLTKSPAH